MVVESNGEPVWFLDCYVWGNSYSKRFPVNSYCSDKIKELIEAASNVLLNDISGIDEIRISRKTRGLNPMYIGRRQQEVTEELGELT